VQGCTAGQRRVASIPVDTDSIPVDTDSIPVDTDSIPVDTNNIPVNPFSDVALQFYRGSEGQSRVNTTCFIPGNAEVSADTFPGPFGTDIAAPL